ncbi:Hsp20 family protein [Geminicoccaceae bacterium 1502E]|nr:Hsp20 family protein [Geminicoccaceae bacterium 1502E]
MTMIDLRPFYRTINQFDRLAGTVAAGGPAYDIVASDENHFAVSLAVPGFSQEELEASVEDGVLSVRGTPKDEDAGQATFLHRGIARGGFERRFRLAEHVEVTGASLENGVLRVELVREVPESKKPRVIGIASGAESAKAA